MDHPTVLLVGRVSSLSEAIHEVVESVNGLSFENLADVDEACAYILEHESVCLVIFHLGKGDRTADVTRLSRTAAQSRPGAETIVIAEEHRAEQELALIRLGVADCLSPPLDLGRLGYLVDVLTIGRRVAGHRPIPDEPKGRIDRIGSEEAPYLVNRGCAMGHTVDRILRIASKDTTILLGGETGTGKSCLARIIHDKSARRSQPFLTINCGSLAPSLVESELFGHVHGSYTGADADRVGKLAAVGAGTLFLDEIDTLSLELQAKLLRVVEERAFEPVGSNKTQRLHARLVVASNRPLDQVVASGSFRADLYYRLNVVEFHLPPLRERRETIPALARLFLQEYAERSGLPAPRVDDHAMRALEAYHWPGNVRELRNAIERAVVLCQGPVVSVSDLPDALRKPHNGCSLPNSPLTPAVAPAAPAAENPAPEANGTFPASLAQSIEQAERRRISLALERNGNNRLRTAAELGVSRMTLYNKLHKYGLIG